MQNKITQQALQIGYKICKSALWQEDKCTWVSKNYAGSHSEVSFAPMEADFYKGLSGTAFFLAALYAHSPRPLFKKTAIAAMQQALIVQSAIEIQHTFSFFRGLSGLLFTLLKIQEFCDTDCFAQDIKKLTKTLAAAKIEQSSIDVIEGLGSGLPALISIQKITKSKSLKNKIREAGERLVCIAEQGLGGVSWNTSASDSDHNLTGFSHGTAGIAAALFKLSSWSKEKQFATTAMQALDYENQYLNNQEQGLTSGKVILSSPQIPVHYDWAHGYAGMAQARLRAYENMPSKKLKQQAIVALERSFSHYSQVDLGAFDISITNGMWGVTDALLDAARILKEEIYYEKATILFQSAISTFEKDGNHWGGNQTMTEEVPDFMISLSGIGYSILRFVDSEKYPSVLCL